MRSMYDIKYALCPTSLSSVTIGDKHKIKVDSHFFHLIVQVPNPWQFLDELCVTGAFSILELTRIDVGRLIGTDYVAFR